jgi:hypothetical protein
MSSVVVRSVFVLMLCAGSALSSGTSWAAAVGALVGLSRCGIGGDAPPNTEYGDNSRLLGGVQGEIGLGRAVSLSLQPMYVRRSTSLTTVDSTDISSESELDLALDYVAVPVVVKFSAASGRTYVAGGVDIGFLTAARLSGEGLDEEVKDSFNSVDVGALLGFGVVFPIGRPLLTTELRYVQGLVNLAGDASGAIRDLPDRFHSDGWQLTAGILFPLGRP